MAKNPQNTLKVSSGVKLLSQNQPGSSDELKQILLSNRSITESNQFFAPVHPQAISVTDVGISITELKAMVKRLQKALIKKEKVVICGDYDADGLCATAIMWQALHGLGLNVMPFIPHRTKHGYGLNEKSVSAILDMKPDLVVTVDNGIVAHRGLELLAKNGVDVILSDHHQRDAIGLKKARLPHTKATLHTTQLCGTTVAYVVAKYLIKNWAKDGDQTGKITPAQWLDLCCLATFSDQMPLTGINRSFAWHGLASLRQTEHVGLLALMQEANIDREQLSEYTVQFGLVPRLNALGRLEHGIEVLRLLCTTDPVKAKTRAELLNQANAKRQTLTSDLLVIAQKQAEGQTDQALIVVADASFHEGIIGLLAGKLMEQYHRPTLVLAVGETVAKGSARSLGQIDITALLRHCQDLLLDVGGHTLAAGCSLLPENVTRLTECLQKQARDTIQSEQLQFTRQAECTLPIQLIDIESARLIEEFAPFGTGNPEPVFYLPDLTVVSTQTMGKDNQHLKLLLSGINAVTGRPIQFEAVMWGRSQPDQPVTSVKKDQNLNVLAKLQVNRWQGREKVQVVVELVVS